MEADTNLHTFLDWHYGEDGDDVLRARLDKGDDLSERFGPVGEMPIHVATRRRRCSAVLILLDYGADIDAKTSGGKTSFAHAARRGFDDLAIILAAGGADTSLNAADRFAVAMVNDDLGEARAILAQHPSVARTGNSEEDRLLADLAGRDPSEHVRFLIDAGAGLVEPGLDGGTPLHQAAWFGQPANARLLIEAGAPLDVFEPVHGSSPLGWAVHGSRFSGDAAERQEAYVELVRMLLEAGSRLHYPDDSEGDAYFKRLLEDASPDVRAILESIC